MNSNHGPLIYAVFIYIKPKFQIPFHLNDIAAENRKKTRPLLPLVFY